ncbi:50S ribosomal protein L11 methyltransferase [Betaproteobacteria bacterium]|nr:50S ribosomal protein L11 methyltransferase [Betaproteobacteria bacterium]
MLKKLIFQVNYQEINSIEQEILFSLISDKLISIGCLSVSNISGDNELQQPIQHIEVIVDGKIHNNRVKKCFEPLVRITDLDELRILGPTNWVESYKDTVKPVIVNNTFFIAPDWIKVPKDNKKLSVIRINPGMAFGTGLHPTTQMCLQLISSLPLSNKNVIDLGCGSGILGIACAKRGARSVMFIDNDVVALGITRENIIKNRCQKVDYKISTALTKNSKKADYIFANILLNPLKNMAKTIGSKVKSKGQIFLSGILIDQVESLLKSYEEHAERKLNKIVELHMKQWACVHITYG